MTRYYVRISYPVTQLVRVDTAEGLDAAMQHALARAEMPTLSNRYQENENPRVEYVLDADGTPIWTEDDDDPYPAT